MTMSSAARATFASDAAIRNGRSFRWMRVATPALLTAQAGEAECGPGRGAAGDRRQQLGAAGPAVGRGPRGHRPTSVGLLRGDEEVDGAGDFRLLGRVAGERQGVEHLAGGERVARGALELAPAAVGALQREQLVD